MESKSPIVNTFVARKPIKIDEDEELELPKSQKNSPPPEMLERIKHPSVKEKEEIIKLQEQAIIEESEKVKLRSIEKQRSYTRFIMAAGLGVLIFLVLKSGKGLLYNIIKNVFSPSQA